MAVSGYSEEGLLKKHPLLGTTHLGAGGRARTGTGRNIHRLRDKAITNRMYDKKEFLSSIRPEFNELKESHAPDIVENRLKQKQWQGRADLIGSTIKPWYHQNFSGRDDFQRMLNVRRKKWSKKASGFGQEADAAQSELRQAATPYNQFFGGQHFDASVADPQIQKHRYQVRGRDWKKRKIMGGQLKGYTAPSGAYPGAPTPSGQGRYLTLLNTPMTRR